MRSFIGILFTSFLGLSFASGVDSKPLAKPSDTKSATRFEALSVERTGLRLVNPVDSKHPDRRLYIGGYAAGGLAVGDLDGDGLVDLFAASGPAKNALYLQDPKEPFRFIEVTGQVPGLDGGDTWAAGVALVDIDNDGDLDLYLCHFDAPNQLFLNETKERGKPVFTERAKEFGIDLTDASFMPYFCDYDRDGDLDLYLATYQYYDPAGYPLNPDDPKNGYVEQVNGKFTVTAKWRKYYGITPGDDGRLTFTNVGRADYLFRNDSTPGKSSFTNVTATAGISGIGVGNSALWWDYNQDGWPDLYVANDFKQPDQLYRNNRNGTFSNVIREATAYTTWFSMGSDVGDVNNDGMLDLLVSDMAGSTHYRAKVSMGEMGNSRKFLLTAEPRQYMRNMLFLGTGTPRFLEAANMAGIASTDWTWSAKLCDLDNDGLLDAFFTNGAARMFNHSDYSPKAADKIGKTDFDLWDHLGPRKEENVAFRNLGGLRFESIGSQWGLAKSSMSYGCVTADFDNDGDLDIVTAELEEPLAVYRNNTRDSQSIRVRLRGQKSNRFGWGAIVRVTTAGLAGTQTRQMNPLTGFMASHEPELHFGLGSAKTVDKLSVTWPSGETRVLRNLKAGQIHTIQEGEGEEDVPPKTPVPLWTPSTVVPLVTHQEKDYDDYARQELLPARHSQLGPGMAVGDVDGDGDEDFYLSRAKGFPRAVYINEGRGRLIVKEPKAFASEMNYEDLGALFFDADRDGDLDLYVVSGSVECDPGDASLQDRLYTNDGRGGFRRAEGAIPKEGDSGSVVCAADFDRDGDLDLFVGSRVIPGRYPEVPASHLWRNNSQPGNSSFAEATPPSLSKAGLVTSALWSDANGDGWIDLLVTLDWGPVKLFLNQPGEGGRMLAETAPAVDRVGWWNGIDGADLDGDGDLDYVVSNFGLNTTYHASPKKPELLYYGDLDGSGHANIVEAKFEKDGLVPRRGLSCSSHAMPAVRDKLKTFHNFGMASLEQVYSEDRLAKATRLAATELQSGALINQGTDAKSGAPKFDFQPVPNLAQLSPAYGVSLVDYDLDGQVDCLLAQNFYQTQPEVGRMAGGLSAFLRGRKTSQGMAFEEVWPKESGLLIQGDAKAVSAIDFNEDGRPDLLVSLNDGPIQAYDNRSSNRAFQVVLKGKAGNPTGVGAKIRLKDKTGATRLIEVRAGGGYLSQSSARAFFGLGSDGTPASIEVEWPSGQKTHLEPPSGGEGLVITE